MQAILFLYRRVLKMERIWMDNVVRAKPQRHIPVVLSRREVSAVLARKYPRAALELAWQYLFPASRLAVDPLRPGKRCRHHVLASSMQ